MISLQKIVIMGTQSNPLDGMARHIVAEVVLMDTTNPDGGRPALYQLKESELNGEINDLPINSFTQVDDDVFVMVGQVASLDHKNKQIHLASGDLVSYRHLVTIGGSQRVEELYPVLHTLMQSLRVQRSDALSRLTISPSKSLSSKAHNARIEHTSLSCASIITSSPQSEEQQRGSVISPHAYNFQLENQL